MENSNLAISIDLLKIKNAKRVQLKNSEGKMIDCIVIPIESSGVADYTKNGAVYLNIDGKPTPNNNYGSTHSLKQKFTKEVYASFTKEEKMTPFLGNVKSSSYGNKTNYQQSKQQTKVDNDFPSGDLDDLTF